MDQFQSMGQPARRPDSASLERLRQSTIDALTDAFSTNEITMEEYERRAGVASGAADYRELEDLTADLPRANVREAPAGRYPARGENRAPYSRRAGGYLEGTQNTACIMGDRNMNGNWLTGQRVSSFTVMGSTKLDLRDVDIPSGPLRIEVFTVMGDTKIIVPYGLPVRMKAFPFMGDARVGREVDQNARGADSWVEIDGFIVMGSLSVVAAS